MLPGFLFSHASSRAGAVWRLRSGEARGTGSSWVSCRTSSYCQSVCGSSSGRPRSASGRFGVGTNNISPKKQQPNKDTFPIIAH